MVNSAPDTAKPPSDTDVLAHYIDNRRGGIDGDGAAPRRLPRINPATGERLGEVVAGTAADVGRAVAAARRAAPGWAGADADRRGVLLWRLADRLDADADGFARLDCLESGRPYHDCLDDVAAAARGLRFCAGMADKIHGQTIGVHGGYTASTHREPYGVVGAIVPWNYPLLNAAVKVGPILAMGNTCVLKPDEKTPSSAVRLAEAAAAAGVPAGVLNVVNGGPAAGAALAAHTDVDKISFTGSTRTGRAVMEASARSNLKPCLLELGGKSPGIVFADADIDAAAEATAFSVFANAGQTCYATTRVLLHADIAEAFTGALAARAGALRVGDPFDPATRLGPLVSSAQLEKVRAYVRLGREAGARVVCGGERIGSRGFYFAPTVLAEVPARSRVATEEIFGPVACLVVFTDEAEAVRLANAVDYGLAAAVWTRDAARLHRMAAAVRAGVVWGNCASVEHPAVPMGGFVRSGFGKESGLDAGYEYTRAKSVWVSTGGDVPHWSGYGRRGVPPA